MDNIITDDHLINQRTIWAANRFWMETENMKGKRYGGKSQSSLISINVYAKGIQGTP